MLALLRPTLPEPNFLEKAAAQAQAALDPVATPLPTTSVIPTNRQLAAAKARAAKDAKKTGTSGPAEQASELNEDAAVAAKAFDLGTDPLAFPDAASMSPAEAKEAALALIRQAYAAGHVKPVKDLQKQYQVKLFYEVPVEQGHDFYQRAMKLSQSVGLQP